MSQVLPTGVSVVIPARDAEQTIERTVHAVLGQHPGVGVEVELIVVDDGSRDATGERALAAGARVITTNGVGPAGARNAGAGAGRSPVIAFCDADCVPAADWLSAGLAALARGPFVQGAVLPEPRQGPGPFDRTLWVTRATGLYEAANLFIERPLFERLGGFERWLGPSGGKELGEDTWLGWRAHRAGAAPRFAREVLVHHAVFPRRATGYIRERARLVYFPALVARIPELRATLFFGRIFLNRRTAAFDTAVFGCIGLARGRRLAGVLLLPYGATVLKEARSWGLRAGVRLVVASPAADAVGAAALLVGSLRSRTVLL